ncbi:hypothetical protein KIW84_041960 [Lathyrus oleraceus]|uniref:Uncharacterized protein n=1 Tax=Pisum sativum TaxID=3888 RepID=A0A9D4XE27_PEA|nr:hypothetical protein KIW84_041960 [Pisum sativum]
MARREEEARVAAAARNDALVQGVALQSGPSVPIPNPVIYGPPPGFVPPPERTHVPPPAHTSGVADGVAAQGPPIVNQVAIPHTDEELQDEFEMQNYNGATPVVIPTAAKDSEAILMCPAAQYPTMPYRPIAPVPIPAPVPHYQVPVPQYQAPQPQFQAPPPQHQQRNQQNNQPRPVQQQRPNQQRPYQQYNNVNTTPIPMTYTQLLPYLIQNGIVVPRALPPMPKPHKPWSVYCLKFSNPGGLGVEIVGVSAAPDIIGIVVELCKAMDPDVGMACALGISVDTSIEFAPIVSVPWGGNCSP